jgi:demethoxyubiquinone hydroxylase (CLK1/Coq7/Cat5 family)
MATNISDQLSEQLLKAATIVESQIDQQLEAIDKLDDDDLEQIRRKRVDEIKRAHAQKQVNYFKRLQLKLIGSFILPNPDQINMHNIIA